MDIKTLDDINKLIVSDAETDSVEYKETTGQLERGMETLCAFLNKDGGTVLFGINDKKKVIGQEVADTTKRNIADAINRRVESVTSTMPQSKYNEFLLKREETRHGWETYPNPELKLSDLDEEEIRKTVRLGIESGRLPETTGNEIPGILEKLNILENGILNNAAAILFAKRKLAQYPQNLLRLARFKGTDKTVFTDNQRVHGNLFQLLDAAMAFIFKHLSMSGTTETLEREEHLEIPYKAIREAVINSLCHRSYRDAGGSVAIAVYDDRLEIENPGSFPSGWDMARIRSEHGSKPRNPLIADTLYIRKVLESWGRGINLIIDECQKAGLPEPEYRITADEVKLIFRYKPAGQPTKQVASLIKCLDGQTLSVREIMEFLALKGRDNFLKSYLYPALQDNLITQTHPEQANHPDQKYRLTDKGMDLLKKQ